MGLLRLSLAAQNLTKEAGLISSAARLGAKGLGKAWGTKAGKAVIGGGGLALGMGAASGSRGWKAQHPGQSLDPMVADVRKTQQRLRQQQRYR